MRIFLAGATGVLGSELLPRLVEQGHEVAGMTRSAGKAERIAAAGALPVVCDVYDLPRLTSETAAFGPEAVIHQLTDLPDDASLIASGVAANARMRTEGTRNLLAAARAAGASRVLAQSVAWEMPPGAGAGAGADAVRVLERAVLDEGGTVLRYGRFYGPGTYYPDSLPEHPRVAVVVAVVATVLAVGQPDGILVVADEVA